MTPVLVFDVNETLLDLRALDPHFERIFGDGSIRRGWFGLVLRNALCVTITGLVVDFLAVGAASLQMVADQHGVALDDEDRGAVRQAMLTLPPHDDVVEGLDALRRAGYRLVALTNSPQAGAEAQLTNAGLADRFERIFSVETVGRFKPAAEVYRIPSDALRVEMADMTMFAAHDWDVAGAMMAGMRGAYVTRPGMVRNPLYPPPDFEGPTLVEVAEKLIAAS
ncbi:MAG TPA: haloacid dehalogenase type II [Acidimicrobiia bacterium]|jgi:2-haloacid dehalogenase